MESEQCAFMVDSHPKVKYCTRSVSRHSNSFSLPTSTDQFYPDCVALLDDGRLLVVEYKSKNRAPEENRDSREKNLIGQRWAKASDGKAIFLMATIEKGDPKKMRVAIVEAL